MAAGSIFVEPVPVYTVRTTRQPSIVALLSHASGSYKRVGGRYNNDWVRESGWDMGTTHSTENNLYCGYGHIKTNS